LTRSLFLEPVRNYRLYTHGLSHKLMLCFRHRGISRTISALKRTKSQSRNYDPIAPVYQQPSVLFVAVMETSRSSISLPTSTTDEAIPHPRLPPCLLPMLSIQMPRRHARLFLSQLHHSDGWFIQRRFTEYWYNHPDCAADSLSLWHPFLNRSLPKYFGKLSF